MNLPILDKWIRGNFLFLCIIVACLFAFFKKTTIFQLEKTNKISNPIEDNPLAKDPNFQQYWNAGLAEVNTYELSHKVDSSQWEGQSEVIFTSENFNTRLQKESTISDDPEATSVLKVNLTQKIASGIYENSSMTSTFTPINYVVYPHALKVVFSDLANKSHEESQLIWKGQYFAYVGDRPIRKEVSQDISLKTAWLEDEIWNRIRLNPQSLPEGDIEMIPSLEYLRNTRQNIEAVACKTSIEEIKDSVNQQVRKHLLIEYPEKHRKLSIFFEAKFPYKISNWESSFEQNGHSTITKARLLNSKQVARKRTQL